MPKEESTPAAVKRAESKQSRGGRQGGDGQSVTTRGLNRWRKSNIQKYRKISRTLALKYYKLDPEDLEGLPFTESPVCVASATGDLNISVSLYNERAVERVAWRKYGGPDGFETYLNSLRSRYLQEHPLGAWEFQHSTAYSRTDLSPTPDRREDDLENLRETKEKPLFTWEPLFGCARVEYPPDRPDTTTATPVSLPAFPKIYRQIPTPMQNLEREFLWLDRKWLWDAGNRVLSFPSNIPDWSHLTQIEREAALKCLLQVARAYPQRPCAPPPASSAYDSFRQVLARAPSLTGRTRTRLVLYDLFGGRRMWRWDAEYMSELFAALIAVVDAHGCGEAGWMSARWEVYDAFSSCIEGLSYRHNRWYDDASDWLRGRMELPNEHAVTTRQDNKSDFGRWYNSILPLS
ncbi:hypothetical protein B0H11DRAFT_1810793 [Mycena galericulata]|nr:hypothetical protein B0H11DRAFT_1810793 [Mycena galericulata]